MRSVKQMAKDAIEKMKVIIIVKSGKGKNSKEQEIAATEAAAELLAEQLAKSLNLRPVYGKGDEDGTQLTFEVNKREFIPG